MKAPEYIRLVLNGKKMNSKNKNTVCTVNGNPVWDYKMNDDLTELRLISEPVQDIDKFDKVTVEELDNYLHENVFWTSMDVVDETTGNEVIEL